MKSIPIYIIVFAFILISGAHAQTYIVSKESFVNIKEAKVLADRLPSLTLTNLRKGDIIKVECNFDARVHNVGRSEGFYYAIKSDKKLNARTPATGIFQSSDGWQSCHRIIYFKVGRKINACEKVNFVFELSKGDLKGEGQIKSFLITAEVLGSSNIRFENDQKLNTEGL